LPYLPPSLAVVGDLQLNAVRVPKEHCIVVGRVVGIEPRGAGLDPERAQSGGHGIDVLDSFHAQAQVMQARRIRIVGRRAGTRGPQHQPEVAVETATAPSVARGPRLGPIGEILHMARTVEHELVLAETATAPSLARGPRLDPIGETERRHQPVVEDLGPRQVAHGEVDVVDADDIRRACFSHGPGAPRTGRTKFAVPGACG
jgi:hypothetical protein